MTFFTGTGRHRVQIAHFFRGQIGPGRPLGVGLVVGKRLYRLRHRCGSLGLPESSGTHCQAIHGLMSHSAERIGRLCPEPGRIFFFSVLDLTAENNPPRPGGEKDLGRCTLRACLAGASAPTRPDIPTKVMPPPACHRRTHHAVGLPSGSGLRAADS